MGSSFSGGIALVYLLPIEWHYSEKVIRVSPHQVVVDRQLRASLDHHPDQGPQRVDADRRLGHDRGRLVPYSRLQARHRSAAFSQMARWA
jgi:hypothetical protein